MLIGFIGLGIMGKPMCKNLLKAGYGIVCYNRSKAVLDDIAAAGGKPAESVADLARQCRVIITMLPNSPEVKEVALGPAGLSDNAGKGSLLIDMSSISPLAAREIHDSLSAKGIRMIDAPVSGGEPKAVDGTLSVMVGGAQSDFDEAGPVLRAMASSVVRVGNIGAGNIAKLANQTIVAVNMAGLAEALTVAAMAGADPELVFQAIRGGLAGSTVMEAKAPMMLDRNITPGFTIRLHAKDLGNVLETGRGTGAPLPLTALVLEMMRELVETGYEKADHSALVRYYENLSHCEVRRN